MYRSSYEKYCCVCCCLPLPLLSGWNYLVCDLSFFYSEQNSNKNAEYVQAFACVINPTYPYYKKTEIF